MNFKNKFRFEERLNEANRVIIKFPERIPIICEKDRKSNNCPDIDKNKYLVPGDLTIGQFIYVIRKRINIPAEKALFVFVNGTIPPTSSSIYSVYSKYKDKDNFLYITYSFENVFGK
jgi:GABA(A) receptor-associated protein